MNANMYKEDSTNFEKGKIIKVDGSEYALVEDLNVNWVSWKGAGAAILVSNPLKPKEMRLYGPELSKGDITDSVNEMVYSMAVRYDRLSKESELEDTERSEMQKLEKFLKAA